jgi:1,4-alpha-glucan branching enzyme
MKQGAFTFVLHSHIPYCRSAGRWPHGEEWIHEAASECYVPLLSALWDLRADGLPFKATIGLTPVLVEQLRDSLVNKHFEEYVAGRIAAADRDLDRYRETNEPRLADLARRYRASCEEVLEAYRDRFRGDIIGAYKSLQDSGHIEIATSAATHGYLPLFSRDSTVAAQIGIGVQTHERAFGRRPTSIWLPECAYRPASTPNGTHAQRPGLEELLEAEGLKVFFSETHAVEGGAPVGKAAGDSIGPYGEVPRRYQVPRLREQPSRTGGTSFQPYYVGSSRVAVIARHNDTGMQVWSPDHGYPGDFWYREFHKRDGSSGLRYWRITGKRVDLADKAEYDIERARETVRAHARHFAQLVEELVAEYHAATGEYGIMSCAYDAELFGHWWFEGVDWLREVLILLASSDVVDLTTATEFVEAHPPAEALTLPASSWGQGGDDFTWNNVDTQWMWPLIHGVEARMEGLAERYADAPGVKDDLLRQAAREALLLQSSDWAFLVTTGQAGEYAISRFQGHLDRFERLADLLDSGTDDAEAQAAVAELYERDNLFAEIDPRLFRTSDAIHPVKIVA